MEATLEKHARAMSAHQQYLDSLRPPTLAEARRISEIQIHKENEINSKYHVHSTQEHDAATKIQAAYRGHRERREQQGLVLDPSSRWTDLIAEMRYRSATAPHDGRRSAHKRAHSSSEIAKMNWRRAGWIAEHAGRGDSAASSLRAPSDMSSAASSEKDADRIEATSMLMDLRYFLEMVDAKHRYGANLQIYHESWQRQTTTQNFFYWLDHGPGRHLDLPLCSREKLDRERIRYLSREERKDYLVRIDDEGRLRWDKNGELITTNADEFKDSMHGIVPRDTPDLSPPGTTTREQEETDQALSNDLAAFSHLSLDSQPDEEDDNDSSNSSNSSSSSSSPTNNSTTHKPKRRHRPHRISPATLLNHLLRSTVKPGTWIYVTDTLNRLYISIKSSGAFQHASFLSGARIRSAGAISVKDGVLTYLSPLSGHYRPTTKSFRDFVAGLEDDGVDLSALKVSGAYKVLKGMEFYGRTKRGFRKVRDGQGRRRAVSEGKKERKALELVHEAEGVKAVDLVERHWERDHHGGRRRRREGS
ncbi:hypothetical protein Q7P37_007559 [Cladosporium fusiforme]